MFRIPKKAKYLLRALALIAKEKTPLSAKAISSQENIPFFFLEKLLHLLAKGGILRSQRGVGGGHLLNKDPNKLTLLEIFQATDPSLLYVECLQGFPCRSLCAARPFSKKMNEAIKNVLENTTLADLLNENHLS